MTENSKVELNLNEDQLHAITGGCVHCDNANVAYSAADKVRQEMANLKQSGAGPGIIEQKWGQVVQYENEGAKQRSLANEVHSKEFVASLLSAPKK